MRRPCWLLLAVAAATSAPAPAPRADVLVEDGGKLVVWSKGQLVRREEISIVRSGDSLMVQAGSYTMTPAPPPSGPIPFDKSMRVVLGAADFGLRGYLSQQLFGPDTLRRGIVIEGQADTVFSVYRELNGQGEGDRLVLPPGRLFVLDPPLFTPFDLICRALHGKAFDQRPVTLYVLGVRDTVLEATVTDLGSETIRWGARPVVARKLGISDAETRFLAWSGPDGRMLKLEQPASELSVLREAPPVKRRAPRPSK
ncbi:MAG: hypothetical protein HZC42_14425 [Candidatus Eisenbacteria bacterium]|nr:hypothetical protein [Candidatus Eisenbacteria bacterium]